MKITRIRIGLLPPEKLRLQKRLHHLLGSDEAPPTPLDDAHHYWAEAIEDGDKFYYRVKGTTVEITEEEFRKVVSNPSLYYFSMALKLHKRIERATEGVPEDDSKFTTDSGSPSLRKARSMELPNPPAREDFDSQEVGLIEEALGVWDVKYPGPDEMIREDYVERLELKRDGTYS